MSYSAFSRYDNYDQDSLDYENINKRPTYKRNQNTNEHNEWDLPDRQYSSRGNDSSNSNKHRESSKSERNRASQLDLSEYGDEPITIMIGGLPHSVTETDLEDNLSYFGLNARAVRLVKKRESSGNRGFAFVDFHCATDAQRWIQMTQGKIDFSEGMSTTLTFSVQKNPVAGDMKKESLSSKGIIGGSSRERENEFSGLGSSTKKSIYDDDYEVYGAGKRPRTPEVIMKGDWKCTQCGTVNFRRRERCFKCSILREDSENEVNIVDGREFIGSQLSETFVLCGLDIDTDDLQMLRVLSRKTGIRVKDSFLVKNCATGCSMRFGFVRVNDLEDAARMMASLGMDTDNCKIEVDGLQVRVHCSKATYANAKANLTKRGFLTYSSAPPRSPEKKRKRSLTPSPEKDDRYYNNNLSNSAFRDRGNTRSRNYDNMMNDRGNRRNKEEDYNSSNFRRGGSEFVSNSRGRDNRGGIDMSDSRRGRDYGGMDYDYENKKSYNDSRGRGPSRGFDDTDYKDRRGVQGGNFEVFSVRNYDELDGRNFNKGGRRGRDDENHLRFQSGDGSEEWRELEDLNQPPTWQNNSGISGVVQWGPNLQNSGYQSPSAHDRNIPSFNKLVESGFDGIKLAPPDMSRLVYDDTSGYHYDPITLLYYDTASEYFYDGNKSVYLYWDQDTLTYIPVPPLDQPIPNTQNYPSTSTPGNEYNLNTLNKHLISNNSLTTIPTMNTKNNNNTNNSNHHIIHNTNNNNAIVGNLLSSNQSDEQNLNSTVASEGNFAHPISVTTEGTDNGVSNVTNSNKTEEISSGATVVYSAATGSCDNSDDTDAEYRKFREDQEIEEKNQNSKQIAKEMDKWVKQQNSQKESTFKKPLPIFLPDSTTKKSSGSTDGGFNVLTKSENLSINESLKKDDANKEPANSLSNLVSSYGIEDEDDDEDESKQLERELNSLEERLIDWDKLACLLCKRVFNSKDILKKHRIISDLHKNNLLAYQQKLTGKVIAISK